MLSALLDTVDAALEARALRVSPAPPPWHAWLVVVLLRHRQRQAWHRDIVDTRLRVAERALGRGAVPDLPGWRYSFHGIGCCLTGPDGEAIDVDRHDDAAAVIDPHFFGSRVRTVRASRFPEMRLWRWAPSEDMIVAALPDLRAAGAILYPSGDHLFRLAPPLEERARAFSAYDFDDASTRGRWLSTFGDADDPPTLEAHRRWVRERALDPRVPFDVLTAARALLSPEELFDVCLHHVTGPVAPAMGRALETLLACAGDATEPVRALLDRLSPTDDPPYPAYQALAYLLQHGAEDAHVVSRFCVFAAVETARGFGGNPFLAQYAVLALRFLPALAMGLVRRALRSNTPICVAEMAALLAAIDQPWCVRELVSALEEMPKSRTIAEALRRSSSELAKRHAARLYVAPTHDPRQVGYSHEEVEAHGAAGLFDGELDEARTLAAELRLRYPAAWDG